MAVGGAEAGDGQARHEEGLEHAVLNEVDALGFLAFVVVLVAAAEPGVAEFADRGIVGDGKKIGQNRLADVLGEGLALFVAALALALEAMAEDFVEEDGGGATGENGRAVEWLSDRSLAQRFEALAELAHRGFEIGLRGKAVDSRGFECLLAEEIHAIVGAGDGDSDDPRLQMRRDDSRPFGGSEVVGLVLHGEKHHVLVHVRVVAEDARQFPHPLLPRGAVDDDLAERLRRCAFAMLAR